MLIQIHEPGQSPMPHEDTLAVGIDLGTTNSLVAIADKGTRQVIRDAKERSLLPSVVAYHKDGSITVGTDAEALTGEKDVCVLRSIKRLMGKGKEDIKETAGTLPYELDAKAKGSLALKVHNKSITPIEISAEILKALKHRAEDAMGKPVSKAVITVPAYFDDAARTATKDAARLAGLEVLRLINEPTAAALAYGLDNAAEGIYAVYDLGGGTFDISLLHMQKGVFKVLATGGDNVLGGDDFDRAIVEEFLSQAGIKKVNIESLKRLLMVARAAKEELTEKASGQWEIAVEGRKHNVSLDKKKLNQLIEADLKRTTDICASVLEDAKLSAKEIKGVVMVGGSTRIPLVKEKVKALFGNKLHTDVDPEKVVALGAATQAEALTKGSDNLLLDVTPLSLGLETMGGLVEKIIYRNTPIPVAKSQEFTTYQDNQGGMIIHVLQGEREMVNQCRSLAKFELKGIPAMPAGLARIAVNFTVDADGLLTVSAREQTTGKEQTIDVKPSYGLEPEQIEEMLRESMEHAREDIRERLLTESRVEAEVAIRTIESAIAKDGDLLDKDSHEKIARELASLKKAIKGTDRDAIDAGIRTLEKVCEAFASKRVNRALSGAMKGKTPEQVASGMGKKKKA